MSKEKIKHIAIIMDGNRRWAKLNNLEFAKGYNVGADTVKEAVVGCLNNGIVYLTCYAFSSENWNRSILEIKSLKKLLNKYLETNAEYFIENQLRFKVIGDYEKFGKLISSKIEKLIDNTKDFTKLTVTFALNYGSRQEIVRGVNLLIKDTLELQKAYNSVGTKPTQTEITIEDFNKYLYTKDMPEPELVIRTGNEKRLSNFLLWQLSYSEFIFFDFMWPEFRAKHIKDAVEEFYSRSRRIGS